MENVDENFMSKSESTKKSLNTSETSLHTQRRLERKQARRVYQSPKSRFEKEADLEKSFETEMKRVSPENILRPTFINIDCIDNSLCYLSPKNRKINPFLCSSLEDSKKSEELISIADIKTKSFIEYENELHADKENLEAKYPEKIKTKNIPSNKKIRFSFINKIETPVERSPGIKYFSDKLEQVKEENKELHNKIEKLAKDVNQLKEENLHLQKTVEFFNEIIEKETLLKEKAIELHQSLHEQIKWYESHIREIEEKYETDKNLRKNHQTLEHMYEKINHQFNRLKERNVLLELNNEKLLIKVSSLSKLLEDCPIPPSKSHSKQNERESENETQSRKKKNERFYKPIDFETPPKDHHKKQDIAIFELSPE